MMDAIRAGPGATIEAAIEVNRSLTELELALGQDNILRRLVREGRLPFSWPGTTIARSQALKASLTELIGALRNG